MFCQKKIIEQSVSYQKKDGQVTRSGHQGPFRVQDGIFFQTGLFIYCLVKGLERHPEQQISSKSQSIVRANQDSRLILRKFDPIGKSSTHNETTGETRTNGYATPSGIHVDIASVQCTFCYSKSDLQNFKPRFQTDNVMLSIIFCNMASMHLLYECNSYYPQIKLMSVWDITLA